MKTKIAVLTLLCILNLQCAPGDTPYTDKELQEMYSDWAGTTGLTFSGFKAAIIKKHVQLAKEKERLEKTTK